MNTGVQRSSATPPTARTATTPAARPGARQCVRNRQVRAEDRCRARDSLSSPPPASPTCTTSRPRSLKAMGFHGARYIQINVPCPLGWGAASQRHDQARPARDRDRTLSDLRGRERLRHAGAQDPPPDAGRRIPEAAAPLRAPVARRRRGPARRKASRRSPTATSRITGCWRTRSVTMIGPQAPSPPLSPCGESASYEAPLRHRARRRHEQAQPDRLVAHAAARFMSTGCRPATPPARRARTSRAGSAHAEAGEYEAAWRALTARQSACPRSWAASAITPAKPPAIGRRSTRRSASIRSSDSSATSRSPKAGRSTSRQTRDGQARARRRRRPGGPFGRLSSAPSRPRA